MLIPKEGKIPYAGFETWYTAVGREGRPPLITLHGGPGAGHGYMRVLDPLSDVRQVLYYDQLGCGNSPADSDPGRWTVELFADELANLIDRLGIGSYHILGQSWGGMLGICFAGRQPEGLKSLILADSPVSVPEWNAESRRLAEELPTPYRETLLYAIEHGEDDSPEFQAAMGAFMKKHFIRRDLGGAQFETSPTEVYVTMQGPSELQLTGTLRDVDLTENLKKIQVPTLVLAGRYDQCTPAVVRRMLDNIENVRAVEFEESGHVPQFDETDKFLQVVARFLAEHD